MDSPLINSYPDEVARQWKAERDKLQAALDAKERELAESIKPLAQEDEAVRLLRELVRGFGMEEQLSYTLKDICDRAKALLARKGQR